jgi:NADH-quinone oxidoreductase subunit J|tara:strand:+ start:1048 stop:1653 length:606 start_codon:yes stop_codon:yes gene_type:complete
MIAASAFYLFSAIMLMSAIRVITASNAVHSVLFLILCFFNAAGLFVLLGAEFVAMILVIVYVGAVAVLFLFVVMMLDVNFEKLREGAKSYIGIGVVLGLVLIAELITLYAAWDVNAAGKTSGVAAIGERSNTEIIGSVLYTDYIYAFQLSGLILLVAMIGAIVLTHRRRSDVRRQKVAHQVGVTREDAMEIKKVESGEGLI